MDNKKKDITVRKFINNDKYLIVFVLFLAVLVWTITSLNIGTDEKKTINIEVPISLSDELSEQVGMKYYSLQKTVDLSITVSGAKYVVGQVGEDDLSIKFDTSNVNRAGVQTIPILVTNKSKNKDFTITSTYPSTIDAYFDVNASKTFKLELKYDDDVVADGYVFGSPAMSEDRVVVSGPKTYVDKIEGAAVVVDLNSDEPLTTSVNQQCAISLEGSGIQQSYLTMTSKTDNSTELSTVSVTLPVLKRVTLPVTVDFENKPSKLPDSTLYITYSTQKLDAGVIGNADINNAVVGKIDFSSINTGSNVFTFDVTKLEGVTILDDVSNVTVRLRVSDKYEKKTIPITTSNVKITGGEKGAKIKRLSKSYITVIAPKELTLTAKDLTIVCDASKQADDNTYPLEITLSDNTSWVYSTYNVTLE